MLYLTDSVQKELHRLFQEGHSGRMDPRVAGERLVTMCPEFMGGYLLLEEACTQAGDRNAAETWLWKACENIPTGPLPHLLLISHLRETHPDSVLSRNVIEMAAWKLALGDKVSPVIQEYFREQAADSKLDFADPDTYGMLATAMEIERQKKEQNEPPEVIEKLLPHQLFTDLQRSADSVVDSELLDAFQANAPRSIPILHAAIRGWARFGFGTEAAICMTAAVLGEIGSTEHLPDLIELSQGSQPPLFLHVHWAIYRILQRFPDAGLEVLRRLMPLAQVGTRCAIAEHLSLIGDPPGIASAFRELLEGFPGFAKEADAAYLLLNVLEGLRECGDEEVVDELARRYLPMLSRDGRKWIRQFDEDDEEFMPMLMGAGIDELSIEDVCLERALMEDGDEDEDDLDDELDDELEDEDAEPEQILRPLRPGRNDLCWCGSGKKYKKCHLDGDEAADREAAEPAGDEPPPPVFADPAGKELVPELLDSIPNSASLQAFEKYFGNDPESIIDDADQKVLFIQWLLFDFRLPSSGRTPVEEFLQRRSRNLSQAHRLKLEAWRDSRLALVEVQRIDAGRGIEVKDLLAGGVYFIHDATGSREAVISDCILCRIERNGDRYEFSGNGLNVTREILPDFLEWMEMERRKKKQSAPDFLAANSHRLHRVLRELHADRLDSLQIVDAEGRPLDDLKRAATAAPAGPAAKDIPTNVERELIGQFKQQHYANWLDESLPALEGKTPREAARTRQGRQALNELLRSMENDEERCRKRGEAAYDFSSVRRELGL